MTERFPWSPGQADDASPVYLISVVAEITGLHPQTLRQYDRLGLVSPGRAAGRGRRYSALDVAMLRRVVELTRDGVNLEGVRRVLDLERELLRLQDRVRQLETQSRGGSADRYDPSSFEIGKNLPVPFEVQGSSAVVLWRRR